MADEAATADLPTDGVLGDIFGKEPEERTVTFCMDRELREHLAEAQQKMNSAQFRAGQARTTDKERAAEIDDLESAVDDIIGRAKGRLIRFTFSAIEPTEYDRIKGEHRPTEKQKTKARHDKTDPPDWNTDTFPPVIVAAACTKVRSPSGELDGLSLEDAQRMWASRSYNEAERALLCNAAVGVQLTYTPVDIPKDA